MGPESLALWLTEPEYAGWSNRSGAAAVAAGLVHRPRREFLVDTLAWERELGLERERTGRPQRREGAGVDRGPEAVEGEGMRLVLISDTHLPVRAKRLPERCGQRSRVPTW